MKLLIGKPCTRFVWNLTLFLENVHVLSLPESKQMFFDLVSLHGENSLFELNNYIFDIRSKKII